LWHGGIAAVAVEEFVDDQVAMLLGAGCEAIGAGVSCANARIDSSGVDAVQSLMSLLTAQHGHAAMRAAAWHLLLDSAVLPLLTLPPQEEGDIPEYEGDDHSFLTKIGCHTSLRYWHWTLQPVALSMYQHRVQLLPVVSD
jgi:hypothetical protein